MFLRTGRKSRDACAPVSRDLQPPDNATGDCKKIKVTADAVTNISESTLFFTSKVSSLKLCQPVAVSKIRQPAIDNFYGANLATKISVLPAEVRAVSFNSPNPNVAVLSKTPVKTAESSESAVML
jgi:hypothetical protein